MVNLINFVVYIAVSLSNQYNLAVQKSQNLEQNEGLLASWSASSFKADLVVAQDGSGSYKTINGAVVALAIMGKNRPQRVIIYVKSGVYKENVEIRRDLENVMFVGDGIDKTTVTGDKNVKDGDTTLTSATFGKPHYTLFL